MVLGLRLFNVPKLMDSIKKFMVNRNNLRIQMDPQFAEDIYNDNNNISTLIMTSSALKILLLVLIILNISYYLGIIWYIFCDLSNQYYNLWGRTEEDIAENGYLVETFFIRHDLSSNSNMHNAITVVYYAFTSLTTVGFGDYYPVSDIERIVIAFVLVFGVATFSYMMGIFI